MILLIFLHSLRCVAGQAEEVTAESYNTILAQNEIVFLYFYADWCRFTEKVTPDFNELANKVRHEMTGPMRVFVGKINYERNKQKCDELSITKFPTFKLYRYGIMSFNEYRGQRTVDAWFHFLGRQLEDPLITVHSDQSAAQISKADRFVVGNFLGNAGDTFNTFKKAAYVFRDHCGFFLTSEPDLGNTTGPALILFGQRKSAALVAYRDPIEQLLEKTRQFCVPLVQKLTYDNAEDFADLGRPLLILFERPDEDENLRMRFEATLSLPELRPFHDKFTFVYTNGSYFTHALYHVGKTVDDLPLIAIDSLKHMYVYTGDFGNASQMKKFFDYFLDGTLHRLYHFGQLRTLVLIKAGEVHVDDETNLSTEPPKSVLKLLAPTKHRYTFKDEL